MARYIDADALLEWIEQVDGCIADGTVLAPTLYKQIITDIKQFPAADVVPKSEVASEIFAEIDTMLNKIQPIYFVDAPLTNYRHIVNKIAKLKEKYKVDCPKM